MFAGVKKNTEEAKSSSLELYNKNKKRILIWSLMLMLLIVLTSVLLLFLGPVRITWNDIGGLFNSDMDPGKRTILLNIRLTRIVSALLGGAALSVSGSIMQIILRNPLGSPFTLGISQAAAFGAAFAVVFLGGANTHSSAFDSLDILQPYTITLSAFFWSLLCTALVLLIANRKGSGAEIMVLAGIAAGSLFSAGTAAFQYIADDVELSTIVFWTFGDIGRTSWPEFFILLLVFCICFLYFISRLWAYAALGSGDELARSLGVRVKRLRILSMAAASLLTAVTVSFFGIIAFVGLVVPHITRRMIRIEEKQLIPLTTLFGALFLLMADSLSRLIISPLILPVGIITSFIGAPLFIYLLLKGMGKKL
jgi:iron complex transport system permease protein